MTEPPDLDRDRLPAVGQGDRRRLDARSRELDALQALGRRAAEAHGPDELFASVVAALHESVELDLAAVAYEWDGEAVSRLFLARPFDDEYVAAVLARGQRLLGWPENEPVEPARFELEGHDAARGPRGGFVESDLVLLPVVRRGQPAACLLVVAAAPPDEHGMRLLYSASNQLSLHLDRIVRSHEVEADRFRAIVEAMPQGVLLADGRLHVLQANRSAEQMLAAAGLGPPLSLGDVIDQLGLADLVERVTVEDRSVAEGEAEAPGDRVWSVTVSRLPAGERSGGLVFVLSDRTESRRVQERLAQTEKMSSLGQMISGVAHELNNPLASIVGYTQLIRGGSSGEEKLGKRLEVLGREAERCRRIVQNLLSFARRREPERKPLSLNQSVENVVALLRYQLRVDGVRIERELSPQLPAMEGDAHQLEQVLVNLLTNAAQAIRPHAPNGTVTLHSRVDPDGSIVLDVHDTGPGIPREMRSKIFDPFFTTKEAGQGTGLGLSLVYGIVTAHGGTIEALGGPGGGATFRLRFPRGGRGARAAEPANAARARPPASAGRVLVVDDDEPVARLICEALERDGLSAHRVQGGRQALEALAAEVFDAVVCDVKMPDMDGEGLYEELRQSRPTLVRRVLWTSGDTLGPGPGKLARRSGLEMLAKPFDLDELRDRVRRLLDG